MKTEYSLLLILYYTYLLYIIQVFLLFIFSFWVLFIIINSINDIYFHIRKTLVLYFL